MHSTWARHCQSFISYRATTCCRLEASKPDTLLKAPVFARILKSSRKSPIAVAGRGVRSFCDEKIPKGIFLREKWQSFEIGMYDMAVFGTGNEKRRRLLTASEFGRLKPQEIRGADIHGTWVPAYRKAWVKTLNARVFR